MEVSFKKITEISDGKVTFYTAIFGSKDQSEFETFVEKDFSSHLEEIQIIYQVIYEMQYRGAKAYYFKPESSASALPKVSVEIKSANENDYGIRLYCVRINDYAVILLNGGIKTALKPQDCPNVKIHFKNAVNIANKIDNAIVERDFNPLRPDTLLNLEFDL